jgi:monofunctional biosynthetic peptidoglycan transglycosylase
MVHPTAGSLTRSPATAPIALCSARNPLEALSATRTAVANVPSLCQTLPRGHRRGYHRSQEAPSLDDGGRDITDRLPDATEGRRRWVDAVRATAARLWAIEWDAPPLKRSATIARRVLWIFLIVTIAPVVILRWAPPPTTAFMIERRVAARLEEKDGWRLRYRWIGFDEIALSARLAVVAAEDQKFPTHHGFDLESISDAWVEYQDGERLRGASTISQQVAKNLFLWSGGGFLRKGLEAYFTVLIETLWPKRRILEVYLNVAEFGDGVFGVGAASDVFFGKDPGELTSYESALLATVLPSPSRMHPDRPSTYVEQRACEILDAMDKLGPAHLDRL